MKYRQSFQFLGWSLIGIYALVLLFHLPQGFEHTNWQGVALVVGGSFSLLLALTKTTSLSIENEKVVYTFALLSRRAIPIRSIVRVVKGANTVLGESFGKITYLVYESPNGENIIRLYAGFTDMILRGFLQELLKKNPSVELGPELSRLIARPE